MKKTHHFFTASIALLLSTGLMLMFAIGTASAHAKVLSATPGIGSVIASVPTSVSVTTAENMNPDPKKSNLFVYGPAGDLISQGNAKIPLNNPKEMSVPIKATGNGVYIVRWITVSADDGDPDEGAFTFTVNPNATNGNTGVTAKPTSTTSASAATTSGSGFPVAPVVITGIVALLVGLGAGFGVGRSRSNAALATTKDADTTQAQDEVRSK
jgi:methionine-rich copper-binding protein CopC